MHYYIVLTYRSGKLTYRLGIIFGAAAGWWWQEVERCTSSASSTPSLRGMAQRGLGDGHALMDSRMAGAPSSGVNGKPSEKLRFDLTPWGWVRGKRGGGDFWSLCTWCFFYITRESAIAVAKA
jgi:hypothetical protein